MASFLYLETLLLQFATLLRAIETREQLYHYGNAVRNDHFTTQARIDLTRVLHLSVSFFLPNRNLVIRYGHNQINGLETWIRNPKRWEGLGPLKAPYLLCVALAPPTRGGTALGFVLVGGIFTFVLLPRLNLFKPVCCFKIGDKCGTNE